MCYYRIKDDDQTLLSPSRAMMKILSAELSGFDSFFPFSIEGCQRHYEETHPDDKKHG